jgi:hypothetical protein
MNNAPHFSDISEEYDNPEDPVVAVCLRCGCGLRVKDIAETLAGRSILWNARKEAEVRYNFCTSCEKEMEKIRKEGVDGAKKREKEFRESVSIDSVIIA